MRIVHIFTAVVVAGSLILGACGSSDSGSTGSGVTPAGASGEVSGTNAHNAEVARQYERDLEANNYAAFPVEYETAHAWCVLYQDGGPNSARLACIPKDKADVAADDGSDIETGN